MGSGAELKRGQNLRRIIAVWVRGRLIKTRESFVAACGSAEETSLNLFQSSFQRERRLSDSLVHRFRRDYTPSTLLRV